KEKAVLRHPKEVCGVAFSPDGKQLATGCLDGLLRVWDLAAGTEKVTWKVQPDRRMGLQFTPDGALLLAAGLREGAKLWDAATRAEKRTWKHGGFYIGSAVFTGDGRWVLTGGYDGTVRLWDVKNGDLRATFSNIGGVYALAFSAEAQAMAVVTGAKYIHVFALQLREPGVKELEGIRALLAKLDDDSYDVREATCQELLKVGLAA